MTIKTSKTTHHQPKTYGGFELGPIRPPSESSSLLIRITRNCPWNRCTFCPVYKGSTFELRPLEHVLQDIDEVSKHVQSLQQILSQNGSITHSDIVPLSAKLDESERMALSSALNWQRSGMQSIFLQDANSLIIKPKDLITILQHLKTTFPWVQRITSYARSHTICRIDDENLSTMKASGLNRIHIGLESGSDKVLKLIKKGADKKTHILAGQKIKKAGMELSEYVMPGLGGAALSRDHALETADALNTINPDFIRLRTLAIPPNTELHNAWLEGLFIKQGDTSVVEEIYTFIESLEGITSTLTSDHTLNLFEEVRGSFPADKAYMLSPLSQFLELEPREQVLFQVGRRTGIFSQLSDMSNPARRTKAQKLCSQMNITPENVDQAVDELMKRFI